MAILLVTEFRFSSALAVSERPASGLPCRIPCIRRTWQWSAMSDTCRAGPPGPAAASYSDSGWQDPASRRRPSDSNHGRVSATVDSEIMSRVCVSAVDQFGEVNQSGILQVGILQIVR